MRAKGVKEILDKNYPEIAFEGKWRDSFGKPSTSFKMLVYGHPKNGKTSFMMQFAKYLAQFGKVLYNSSEEGDSKTIQEAFITHKMDEIGDGKFMLLDRLNFKELMQYLNGRNRGKYVIIDSRDYMNLTSIQYKKLITTYPNKCFIIICWESGGKPKSQHAKDMEYMVDIIVHVANFRAKVRSRFGGCEDFIIWDRKPKIGEQSSLNL